MKKILIVFRSYHYSGSVVEWLRRMNENAPLLATGIFLPASAFASVFSYAATANAAAETGYFPAVDKEEAGEIEKEMSMFEQDCIANGIECRLHPGRFNLTLPDLRLESRFADLMLISGESFFGNDPEKDRIDQVRDIVQCSECPVLIIPEHFIFPQSVILAYDGSENSVFSIRQFTYVMKELTGLPTLLFYASGDEYLKELPHRDEIIELTARHFSDLTTRKIELEPKEFFKDWIENRKGSLLVSGSFGRSDLSQFFRKSFASDLVLGHHIPVFVAHRR